VYGKGEREPLIPEEVINRYKSDRRAYEDLHRQNRRAVLHVTYCDKGPTVKRREENPSGQ
jgi:hypothetical protein